MNNLRHSFASQHLTAGTPPLEVSAMMGHSDPAVTLRVYSQWAKTEHSTAETALAGRIFGAVELQEQTGERVGSTQGQHDVSLCQMPVSEKNMQKADLSMEKLSGSTLEKGYHKLPNPGAVRSNRAGGIYLCFTSFATQPTIHSVHFSIVSAEYCHETASTPSLTPWLVTEWFRLRITYPGDTKNSKRIRCLWRRHATILPALSRRELVEDLGDDDNISTQQSALIDLAVKSKLLIDSVDAWLLAQPSLVNKRKKALLPVVLQRQTLADGFALSLTARP